MFCGCISQSESLMLLSGDVLNWANTHLRNTASVSALVEMHAAPQERKCSKISCRKRPVCFSLTLVSQLIWLWNCFFLLSTLTSCLFLMTHFWETAPEATIGGFIHKGQRRQLHPEHMKPGTNPSWALASHWNCALFHPLHHPPSRCHGDAPGELGPGPLFLSYTPPPQPLCV